MTGGPPSRGPMGWSPPGVLGGASGHAAGVGDSAGRRCARELTPKLSGFDHITDSRPAVVSSVVRATVAVVGPVVRVCRRSRRSGSSHPGLRAGFAGARVVHGAAAGPPRQLA